MGHKENFFGIKMDIWFHAQKCVVKLILYLPRICTNYWWGLLMFAKIYYPSHIHFFEPRLIHENQISIFISENFNLLRKRRLSDTFTSTLLFEEITLYECINFWPCLSASIPPNNSFYRILVSYNLFIHIESPIHRYVEWSALLSSRAAAWACFTLRVTYTWFSCGRWLVYISCGHTLSSRFC